MSSVRIVPIAIAAILGALVGTTLARMSVNGDAAHASVQQGVRHIQLPGRDDQLPYSNAVRVGDTLYLAGDIGVIPGTRTVPDTAAEEARLLMESFQRTLEHAGYTMDDLVYVQVFCSDVKHYEEFNAVYRTYFKERFPARAFIGSGPLLFGARFELQGIAAKP
jgi:2-iminobutanoate/2-iminopropanoate deaminase